MAPGLPFGLTPGLPPGLPPSFTFGLPPGLPPGFTSGFSPSLPPGFTPGFPPGFTFGFSPGQVGLPGSAFQEQPARTRGKSPRSPAPRNRLGSYYNFSGGKVVITTKSILITSHTATTTAVRAATAATAVAAAEWGRPEECRACYATSTLPAAESAAPAPAFKVDVRWMAPVVVDSG